MDSLDYSRERVHERDACAIREMAGGREQDGLC
jgi:hypothetical protein